MARIPNWTLDVDRNASDVDHLMSATVREWEHEPTGERIRVTRVENPDAIQTPRYDISYHGEDDPIGETVTARDTLTDAVESVRDTMRENPDGLDIEEREVVP